MVYSTQYHRAIVCHIIFIFSYKFSVFSLYNSSDCRKFSLGLHIARSHNRKSDARRIKRKQIRYEYLYLCSDREGLKYKIFLWPTCQRSIFLLRGRSRLLHCWFGGHFQSPKMKYLFCLRISTN